ncbi:DNA primase [bacterium]|nr:DNA primase [bacterium]
MALYAEVNRLVSERISLDKLISKYAKLEPTGKGFKCLCPFHNEKTPSFHINTDMNFFYCFGCGISGNAITFLMKKEGYSYSDAVKKLGEDFNIPELLKDEPKIDREAEQLRNDIFEANKTAARIFMQNLENSTEAREYLEKRGVTDEMKRRFAIGFIGDGDDFIAQLQENGVSLSTAARAGLVKIDENSKVRSFFFNRLMFPIISRKNVIAFGGRVMSGTNSGPKYLNTSDTPVFNKKHNLFGIDFVRESLREFPYVVLCEGYFDVVAMHQHGFQTAVAALGTAVSDDHLEILSKFNKPLVVMLDGDSAGRKAAKRIAKLTVPEKLDLRVAFIPDEGEDPDSMLKKEGGEEKIRALIENSNPLFQELLDEQLSIFNSLDNVEEKLNTERTIRDIFKNIPANKVKAYANHVQKRSNGEIRIFRPALSQIKTLTSKAAESEVRQHNPYEGYSFENLRKPVIIALLHNEFIKPLEEVRDYFTYSGYGALIDRISEAYDEGEPMDSILENVDPSGDIAEEFKGKSETYIEKSFTREIAGIKIAQNEMLYKTLCSDPSDEAKQKIADIIKENRELKKIERDNRITSDNLY